MKITDEMVDDIIDQANSIINILEYKDRLKASIQQFLDRELSRKIIVTEEMVYDLRQDACSGPDTIHEWVRALQKFADHITG